MVFQDPECYFAECLVLFTTMLGAVMLNVIMLSVVAVIKRGYIVTPRMEQVHFAL
jgi:hypothetical protein